MSNFQVKTTNLQSLEAFIKKREDTMFQPLNCKKKMYFIASQKTKELPQERLKHGMIVVSEFKIKDHDF